MSKELIRSDSVLGTQQVVAGSRDKDFVIQTKGKVKIQQGSSFIDLIKDGKINAPTIIHVVDTVNDIGTKTGFYYVRNEDGMYALVEKSLIPLGGGAGDNNNNSEGVTKLSELEDVMLVNLRDGDLLVQQGGYWVNTLFNVNDLEDMITGNLDEIRDALKNQSDFTQRTWQDVMETFDMMFDPEGNYFTEKITPLAVHTAQLIVGTNSQQFSLENIKFSPNHLGDENRFAAFIVDISRPGLLIHNTIGLENNDDTVGATWEVLHNISGSLTAPDFDQTGLDPGKPYYLYAKCSKTSNQGEFLLSTEQKLLESEDGYYMFWVGVLNTPRASLSEGGSEISGGVSDSTVKASKVRSFQTMYGFTEIAGNTITTGVIKDQTGNCYWDMINGNFRIGNRNTYVRFDSDTGKLFLKGNLTQVDTDRDMLVIVWRGQWYYNPSTTYNKGDVVYYNGSTYICKVPCYGNIYPTDTDYWDLYTSKGDAGAGTQWAFKLTTSSYTPSSPDSSSGWSDSANGLNVSPDYPYLWMSTRTKPEGGSWGYWSTPSLVARYAKDGDDGSAGPALNFVGTFNTTDIYYATSSRADVVEYDGSFYMANYQYLHNKSMYGTGTFKGNTYYSSVGSTSNINNRTYWTPFGASFTSIATGILVVTTKAAICGWQMNNSLMWANSRKVYLNGGSPPSGEKAFDHSIYPVFACGNNAVVDEDTNTVSTINAIIDSMDRGYKHTMITGDGRLYSNYAQFTDMQAVGIKITGGLSDSSIVLEDKTFNNIISIGNTPTDTSSRKYVINISSYGSNTTGIRVLSNNPNANQTNYAMQVYGPCVFKQRGGETWDSPGVVGIFKVSGNGTRCVNVWGNSITSWKITRNGTGRYTLTHDLNHLNYCPNIISGDGSNPFRGSFAISSRTATSVGIWAVDTEGRDHDVEDFYVIFLGRNKNY